MKVAMRAINWAILARGPGLRVAGELLVVCVVLLAAAIGRWRWARETRRYRRYNGPTYVRKQRLAEIRHGRSR